MPPLPPLAPMRRAVELYSHVPAISHIVAQLQRLGFRVSSTYLLDSQFVADAPKFISALLCCLSAMTSLELPHINVLTKCDLLPSRKHLDDFLDADAHALSHMLQQGTRPDFYRLNSAICELADEWSMVQFMPLDPRDPDTIEMILAQVRRPRAPCTPDALSCAPMRLICASYAPQ